MCGSGKKICDSRNGRSEEREKESWLQNAYHWTGRKIRERGDNTESSEVPGHERRADDRSDD